MLGDIPLQVSKFEARSEGCRVGQRREIIIKLYGIWLEPVASCARSNKTGGEIRHNLSFLS